MTTTNKVREAILETLTSTDLAGSEALHRAYTIAEENNVKLTVLSASELVEIVPALKKSHCCPDSILFNLSSTGFGNSYVIFDKNINEIVEEVEELIASKG